MRILWKWVALQVVFGACLASIACASVQFRFTGTEQNVEYVPWSAQGEADLLTVTTTGHVLGQADTEETALSYVTPLGLGVNNTSVQPDDRNRVPVSLFQTVNTFQVESAQGGEFVRLVFSAPAQLDLVYFTDAGAGERFSLYADGQAIDVNALFGTDEIIKIHPAGMVQFPETMPFATTYDFVAHSSWNLHNVHVTPDTSHAPEPAGAIIWCGFGLPLLGWRRMRRHLATVGHPLD
jgi:hypothetical protein